MGQWIIDGTSDGLPSGFLKRGLLGNSLLIDEFASKKTSMFSEFPSKSRLITGRYLISKGLNLNHLLFSI